MKLFSHITTSTVQDTAPVPSPLRVCMHVAGEVREDNRIKREATALIEAGLAICIIDVDSDSTRPVEEDISGIHVEHVIMPAWYRPTRSKWLYLWRSLRVRLSALLRLLQTSADIYHAHDLGALPPCYVAARLHHAALIFDAHELKLPEANDTYWLWMQKQVERFLVSMLSRCTDVITVSSPIAWELARLYALPKVTLVRNVPVYRAVEKNDRLRQHLALGPNARIALYQGNLQPDRGLDTLVRAAAFLEQDNVIVLMGYGVGTTQAELEALIAREGLADHVKILAPVPYAELLDWTASADIGLIVYSPDYSPNVQMCLPNKLFEYLMAGLPILASPLEAVTEIITTYDVGQVVHSLKPVDIGAAINAILADHVACARMHDNALHATKQELCWEKEKVQLINLYHNITLKQHEKYNERITTH